MKKRLYLIFSHKLTDEQKNDALRCFGEISFIYLPVDVQKKWSNINPESRSIAGEVKEVIRFIKDEIVGALKEKGLILKENFSFEKIFATEVLKEVRNDLLFLVEGEFGATYFLVRFLKSMGFKVFYSTTKRIFIEKKLEDGSIENVHIFKHIRFREYEEPLNIESILEGKNVG